MEAGDEGEDLRRPAAGGTPGAKTPAATTSTARIAAATATAVTETAGRIVMPDRQPETKKKVRQGGVRQGGVWVHSVVAGGGLLVYPRVWDESE